MDPLAHASIGLMAKPLVPKAPLWALLAATQVPDLLSFGFIAAGLEHGAVTKLDFEHGLQYLSPSSIAWSHGLLMSVVWSLLIAAAGWIFFRDRRVSVTLGLMVFSHWLLDFIVYRYIPVFLDNSQTTGLGLITSSPGLIAGIVMEVVLISAGIAIYWIYRKRTSIRAL
jgi:membrane-bound metal-dependent hydrolase YbcI (DUF457 family)